VAIVTGAARGIGRAMTAALAAEGARVAIADIDAAAAQQTVEALHRDLGGNETRLIAVGVDVANLVSVRQMAETAATRFGGIDVLVNNAAMWRTLQRQPFWEIPSDEWDQVMAINVRGPLVCSAAVLPYMRQRGKGKIILIGSTTIWSAQSRLAHYTTSKAALVGLARCMARELGPDRICVNVIHPGPTDTGVPIQPREYLEERSRLRAIPRVQTPEDLAGAVVFLASDESDFVTGQQLIVDGGMIFG
jgi:NAD(P)-dependent dehydrogenase (short-subunit alcohol dehydrogenase family)